MGEVEAIIRTITFLNQEEFFAFTLIRIPIDVASSKITVFPARHSGSCL
jgi:hypothetical protein